MTWEEVAVSDRVRVLVIDVVRVGDKEAVCDGDAGTGVVPWTMMPPM